MFSRLIIGCMRWGIWGSNLTKNQTSQLIETCLEEGFTTFDHADIYGDYTTEALFGSALENLKLDRTQIQLISKCGIVLKNKNNIKYYNYDFDYIIKSVEQSLKNLRTDYLDLLLLHRPSPLLNPEIVAEAFQKLNNDGKVKSFGVSNFSTSQFEILNQFVKLETNQIEISATETKAFFDGSLDQMMSKNICPQAWSVMGNYFSDENKNLTEIIKNLAEKHNMEEDLILLSFILKHPSKILPIVGTTNIKRIKNYKKAFDIKLNTEDWFKILEASRGKEVE